MNHSNSSVDEFDVFVNFRGADLRKGLVDILRYFMRDAGIRFFYDDESIHPGDEIPGRILRSIESSHIYIAMLSERYAESRWCLRELAHMVRCQEESNGRKVILPFFCGVTVDNVKLKEGLSYETAFRKLHAEAEKRQEWEEALRKVSRIKGPHMGETGNVDFSRMIVREAQLHLKKRHLSYHLVGEYDEADLGRMLDIGSGGVRFLVIHGNRGTGKTTLARTILQQLSDRFQGSSFVTDIREISTDRHLEARLKCKMLRDICGDHGNSGDIMKDFRDKRVLIVLDDVEEQHQIKNLAGTSTWFGPGSRIIITTSNREVLSSPDELSEECITYPPREVLGHEVTPMKFDQSRQLFSRYAFSQDSPPRGDFDDLSRDIVKYSEGLPLILEVMGSLLHRERNQEQWNKIIEHLKKCKTVETKLEISYNKLESSIQETFLDVACFFVNEEKTNPTYMWRKVDGLEALLMLSLVKIVDGDKLWMHDYLRDLGRDIVREKCKRDILKRCRVWEHKEAKDLLENTEGREQQVEALCFPCQKKPFKLTVTPEQFSVKPNLRFLKLSSVGFKGDFENKLRELRWLSWHSGRHDFVAENFAPASLVILDLAQSRIEDGWNAWKQLEENNDLKVIDLTSCEKITKTPRFSRFQKLERLILEDCTNVTEIDSSIGELKGLKSLNIKGCDSLKGLPEGVRFLESLIEIRISKKKKGSFSLPEEIGSLESLTILEIVNVKLNELPESIGRLKNLQGMSLLRCSGFEQLPDSVGNLRSLAELQISETEITGLPESIGLLKELKVIKMEHSLITSLPGTITGLEKLEELHAKNSKYLQGKIPEGMDHLKILDLSHTSVNRLPNAIGQLSHLQKLQLQSCDSLQHLTELPQNLISLGITVPAASQVRGLFKGMTKLEKLELHVPHDTNCSPKFQFPGQLQSLLLSYRNLRCCLELPSNLSELILKNMKVHTRLPHFPDLKNLSSLEIHDCDLVNLCNSQVHLPEGLRVLHISQCKFPRTVLHLSGLKCLKLSRIVDCKGLDEVKGLGELESLEELIIHSCVSLVRLGGDISQSKGLKVLSVHNNHELESVEGLEVLRRNSKRGQYIYVTGRSLSPTDL